MTPDTQHPCMTDIYRQEVELLRTELALRDETIRRLELFIRRSHDGLCQLQTVQQRSNQQQTTPDI